MIKGLFLCLLILSVSMLAQTHEYISPDQQAKVVLNESPSVATAKESTVRFYSSAGGLLLEKSYASKDGEHGYRIINGQWTADSKFFVFCMVSSGGHQPWHFPTSVYSVATNRIYSIDALYGPVATGSFRLLSAESLETKILKGDAGASKTIVVQLSALLAKEK